MKNAFNNMIIFQQGKLQLHKIVDICPEEEKCNRCNTENIDIECEDCELSKYS